MLVALVGGSVSTSFADTQTNGLCTPSGYTVGFFNGVFNSYPDAINGLNAIWQLRGGVATGDTFKNEPVEYELFYNSSGGNAGSDATLLQDVMEVFIQRANEIDRSGALASRKEIVWELIKGDNKLLHKLAGSSSNPEFESWRVKLENEIKTKIIAKLAGAVSSPPTQSDSIKHKTRLDALAIQRQKLMFIAHSQGNLFMNEAYRYIKPKIGEESVKVVHIAPASVEKYGDVWLAEIDNVINGLRLTGNVLPFSPELSKDKFPLTWSDILPFGKSGDIFGHELIATYLDKSRIAKNLINSSIIKAMNALATPTTGTGNVGSFTVTLTWNGSGDVDLHTFEPNGFHSYYSNREGPVGFLDVDNRSANGPERYFASCDPNILQTGTYKIGINNYSRASGRIATLQVATKEGVIFNKTLGVGAERGSSGDQNPIQAVNVDVSKDATTGKFKISIPISDVLNPL